MTSGPDRGYYVHAATLEKLGGGDAKAGRRVLRSILELETSHQPINGPTERPPDVRVATEVDEEGVLALLRLDFAENARHVAPLDEQRIKSFVYSATRDKVATLGVIDGPIGVVGMVYLEPEVWWWATEWYVAERLTYVHPDHRSGQRVASLIKFARSFVDNMSAQLGYRVFLIGSVVATKDARTKTALFGRMLNFAGGVFAYPDPAVPRLLN